MRKTTGRYSGYIRPFSYVLDLIIINVLAWLCSQNNLNVFTYHIFISITWFTISWNIDFYEIYRFTKPVEIFSKIVKQYILFVVLNFAYMGYYMEFSKPSHMIGFVTSSLVLISASKFFIFYALKRFRVVFGGNFRKVIIVGNDKMANQLADFFNEHPDYGYKLTRVFDFAQDKEKQIKEIFTFAKDNGVDEIYCSLSNLNDEDVNDFIDFTDNNFKVLKFLPDTKDIFARNLVFDYYGYIPVLSQRIIPLDKKVNKVVKRLFDIVFSLVVIVTVLSWLTPIIAIIIKMESKGPVFFKQKRNGLNYKVFDCFKFRSMRPNAVADSKLVEKNDPRVTKVGAFMRKTSIDELPQFFNVLLGDMSVIGPRPQMIRENERFVANKIDKFMVRHFIKPGITGLAQTNGYRGDVETPREMTNRVRYDIIYIENWSLILDLKIVVMTVYDVLRGEEKAY